MEIEAKFAIPDADAFFRLQTIDQLAGFTLLSPQINRVRDTYFDSSDRRILAAGYACRVRQRDEEAWVTLKEVGRAQGAVHRREELEMALPGVLPFARWPAGPVRNRMRSWLGDACPVPLFTLRQTRSARRVMRHDRTVAEWSLDQVRLTVGEGERLYFELEIELAPGGTEEDLAAVVTCLKEEWGLVPESRSKFERGLNLLERERLSRRPVPSADDTMAEAARKTLAFHFRRMLFHEPGTRLGKDIEALHDMRVATRRMRAAFGVFGDYLNLKALAPLPKGLRRTGRRLGTVRDLDVFWEKARRYLDALPEGRRDELAPLREVWQAERGAAREKMLVYLDGDGYARFKARFATLLQTPEAWPLPGLTEKGEALPRRLRHVVPMVVYRRLAEVLAYD
jgi:inorganic triphosphatase YgiF